MKRLLVFLVLVASIVALLPSSKVTGIAYYTDSMVFTAKPSDGYIQRTDDIFADAWTATSGQVVSTNETDIVGGEVSVPRGGPYVIYRGFLYFDTSALTPAMAVEEANLSLYTVLANYGERYNITLQYGLSGTYPHEPLDDLDYYKELYWGDGGTRNASTAPLGGWWNITLNYYGKGWIHKYGDHGGLTKYCLRSTKDINGEEPVHGTSEYLAFRSYEYGVNYAAKLSVIYSTSNVYLIHGIYYDDGTSAPVKLSVRIVRPPDNDYVFTFDATAGHTTVNFTSGVRPLYMTWNASSALNYTRIYFFLNASFEETWLFIPKVDTRPTYPYQFTVSDFYGMTDPFLETTLPINGTIRIVERKSLSSVGTLSFIMEQWQRYGLRFRCLQGLYSLNFIAETTLANNLQVLSDAFPTAGPGNSLYAYASRTNGSIIHIDYSDPSLSTQWLFIQITHQDGTVTVIDYQANQSLVNSLSYDWTSGLAAVDYRTVVISFLDQQYTWAFSTAAPLSGLNPWDGLFEALGTWPTGFSPEQIPAALIIIIVLGIFSYASTGVGCVMAWLATGAMILLNWYAMALPTFGFAGFVSFLVVVAESKKTEREL